jgi:response regulator RpfG family c-di-GMP phosphodiesterase
MTDKLMFKEEEAGSAAHTPSHVRHAWKIIIADDEPAVHDITLLALNDIEYDQRKLQFLHAHSGAEAIELLRHNPDTALLLLDVVMETDDAGLKVVDHVRNELGNKFVRIILRTGQPGQAPEHHVIQQYDINDYKEKTELTSKKLFTTVITALRSYHDIMRLEQNRRGLEKILSATSNVFRLQSMEQLTSGVLMQVMSIIGMDEDAFFSHASGFVSHVPGKKKEVTPINNMLVISATGRFESHINQPISKILNSDILQQIDIARSNRKNIYSHDSCVVYIRQDSLIYIDGYRRLGELEKKLLDIFCANIAVAFENVELNDEILDTQKEIIFTLGSTTEFRCRETGNHIVRVSELSKKLAQLTGLTEEEAELIKLAAPMHDVGKIGIPDNILLKPGKLTTDEYEVMKTHTTIGYELLKTSTRPIFQAAALIAYEHQERWDGSGYPRGLSGDDIHIYGRIIALVDVFDALASKRCYKDSWTADDIRQHFIEMRGIHYDPQLVDLLLQNFEAFVALRDQFKDE